MNNTRKIFIIDDNLPFAYSLARVLQWTKENYCIFNSKETLFSFLNQSKPVDTETVYFINANLNENKRQGKTGLELLYEIRVDYGSQSPAIICSFESKRQLNASILDQEGHYYLQFPFTLLEVKSTVEKALNDHSLEDSSIFREIMSNHCPPWFIDKMEIEVVHNLRGIGNKTDTAKIEERKKSIENSFSVLKEKLKWINIEEEVKNINKKIEEIKQNESISYTEICEFTKKLFAAVRNKLRGGEIK